MLDFPGLLWVQKEIKYLRYLKLAQNRQLIHGIFTRHGGLSNLPYNCLNISHSVGDRPEDVTANLCKIKEAVGAESLMLMDQTHGTDVRVLREGRVKDFGEIQHADAMITDIPRIALLVKQADCQGIIIFDPKKVVVANVHCGWRGNVKNILGRVVRQMKEEFGCVESDLMAAIGPSLGPCCAEFLDYKDMFPEYFRRFLVRDSHFDLWAVSCRQLIDAGLNAKNIELAGICSCCRTDLFFSYRRESVTGRFGIVAMIKEDLYGG